MVFPICPLVVSNKAKGVGNRGLWKKHDKVEKTTKKYEKKTRNLEL